jgi:pSer/pThr/pTyr-binding forkhead associated (FHA) protein
MSGHVILAATAGRLKGKTFAFRGKSLCVVGRSPGCALRLPAEDHKASRRHCLLAVDAPLLTLHDLGSRNGTYVNGRAIGRRAPTEPAEPGQAIDQPGRTLADGDEVRLGSTVFRVHIEAKPETDARRSAWSNEGLFQP